MSYINEALKKAQNEKDAKGSNYIQSLEASGGKTRSLNKWSIYYILIIIFIILMVLLLKSWSGSFSSKEKDNNGNTSQIKEKLIGGNLKNTGDNASFPYMNESTGNDKNHDEILFNKAAALAGESRIEEAKLTYREVLKLNPGHVKTLNDLGVLLLHEGEYELAIGHFEKAIRLNPDNVDPYYNLACLYALSGDKEKGIAYLIKAAELDSRVKDWIKQDADLASLRDLPEFDAVTE